MVKMSRKEQKFQSAQRPQEARPTHLDADYTPKPNRKGFKPEFESPGLRRDHLTRGSRARLDRVKLRLLVSKVLRDVNERRARLRRWDPVEEEAAEALRAKKEREEGEPKKKRGRLGPETWKLRGAARPAAEVYDFDTRYDCPYEKEKREQGVKERREVNLLRKHEGAFGAGPRACVEFLGRLAELGGLYAQTKKYK